MRVIIIGAGPAGLYLAEKLLHNNIDCVVLEKNAYIGGKCQTVYTQEGLKLESGASVFHNKQPIILNLMEKYGLSNNIVWLPKDRSTFIHNSSGTIDLSIIAAAEKKLMQQLADGAYPDNSTFDQAAQHILSKDEYTQLATADPTWQELAFAHPKSAYNSFIAEQDSQIGLLSTGISKLVQAMAEPVHDAIVFETEVKKISKKNRTFYIQANNKTFEADCVVLATSLPQAEKMSFDQTLQAPIQTSNAIISNSPSLRVYAHFAQPQSWLKQYDYIISDLPFRWAIKINNTLAMISYCDGAYAQNLLNLGQEKGTQEILQSLQKTVLPHTVSHKDIVQTWWFAWHDGISIWNKQAHAESAAYSTHPTAGLYQTYGPDPENFGANQGWIEAHLQAADAVYTSIVEKYNLDNA